MIDKGERLFISEQPLAVFRNIASDLKMCGALRKVQIQIVWEIMYIFVAKYEFYQLFVKLICRF